MRVSTTSSDAASAVRSAIRTKLSYRRRCSALSSTRRGGTGASVVGVWLGPRGMSEELSACAARAAQALGWPIGTYSCHENGHRGITADAAQRYARAFNVDPSWLLYASIPTPEQRAEADEEPSTVQREPPVAPEPQLFGPSGAVTDRTIAEIISVLADEYEELNQRGRESLTLRFWSAFPDLRERSLDRVVAWLGWRAMVAGLTPASNAAWITFAWPGGTGLVRFFALPPSAALVPGAVRARSP